MKGGLNSRRGPAISTIMGWAKETKGDPETLADLLIGLSIGVVQGRVKPAVLNSVNKAIRTLEWLSHMEQSE